MKRLNNQKGITLIALIVTIIVLVIIAGISIATLTADNGVLRQTNSAKVENIEGTAREQVKLAMAAMRLAIAEAQSLDNSYKASENTSAIQAKLLEVIKADTTGLEKDSWSSADDTANSFKITYAGEDYKNACNDDNAEIVYTITLGQKSIEITNETNSKLKDQAGNDVNLDVGGSTESGSGSGSGSGTGDGTGSGTGTKLVEMAKIGQLVNYDPTSGGNVTDENTEYTSIPGSTTEHGNGYTSLSEGQTFSAGAYKASGGKWRILNIEGETITLISDPIYRDNEDGTAMLTASDSNGLYLSNGIGYIWAEEELHRIGAIYGHGEGADTGKTVTYYYGGPNDQDSAATGEYALTGAEAQQGRKTTLSLATPSGGRAITVDDINKICGKTYAADYSSGTQTKNSSNAKYYPTLNGESTTGRSKAQTTFSGDYYKTYYSYSISSINSDTDAKTAQNDMLKLGVNYWLGSRCVHAYSNDAYFNVRYVISGGNVGSNNACYCAYGSWNSGSPSRAVRAVVNLKSGIQTSDETYEESTGWNLVES